MHDGYPQKGGKKCDIVASRENILVCALSLQLLKEQGWGLTSHALCVSVGKSHVSTSAGPQKLAPLRSLMVLWVRQAAELQLCGGGL